MCESVQVPARTIQEGKGHALLIPGHWGSWSAHGWRENNSPLCRALSLCLRTFPKLSEAKEFSQWLEGALHTQRWHLESLAADFLFPCDTRLIHFWIHSCPEQWCTCLPAQAAFQTVLLRLFFLSSGSHLLSNCSVNINHSSEGIFLGRFYINQQRLRMKGWKGRPSEGSQNVISTFHHLTHTRMLSVLEST